MWNTHTYTCALKLLHAVHKCMHTYMYMYMFMHELLDTHTLSRWISPSPDTSQRLQWYSRSAVKQSCKNIRSCSECNAIGDLEHQGMETRLWNSGEMGESINGLDLKVLHVHMYMYKYIHSMAHIPIMADTERWVLQWCWILLILSMVRASDQNYPIRISLI